jgi:hypothetical protein
MLDDLDLYPCIHPVQKKILKASIALKSEKSMTFVFQFGHEQLAEDLAHALLTYDRFDSNDMRRGDVGGFPALIVSDPKYFYTLAAHCELAPLAIKQLDPGVEPTFDEIKDVAWPPEGGPRWNMTIGPFQSQRARRLALDELVTLTGGSVTLRRDGSMKLTNSLGRMPVHMTTPNVSNVRMSCCGSAGDLILHATLNAPLCELRDARMEIEVALAAYDAPIRIVPKNRPR